MGPQFSFSFCPLVKSYSYKSRLADLAAISLSSTYYLKHVNSWLYLGYRGGGDLCNSDCTIFMPWSGGTLLIV